MAYYDALIAAWNSATQPPSGVTGSGLVSTDTTAQKVAKINAWSVTGVIPGTILSDGAAIANSIIFSEFNALTAAQQQNILMLLSSSGQLLGGSANTNRLTVGMLVGYFGTGSQTITNMTALAKATTEDWCFQNGYPTHGQSGPGNLSVSDANNAGLT